MALLTTLVVENLFAEMRDGNDIPLVLQFTQIVNNPLRAPEEEYQMQLQLFHQFLCILLKATGFPTILYKSNHVQTRERFQGDQATTGRNAKVARRIRPKCSPGRRT